MSDERVTSSSEGNTPSPRGNAPMVVARPDARPSGPVRAAGSLAVATALELRDLHRAPARGLVVDDEPSICEVLAKWLGRHGGFEVLTATSGEAALAILRHDPIDVLVLDLRIPDLRGDAIFELAAALQPHLRSSTLFITGDITERAQALIGACGCHFERKPFRHLRDVEDAVRALVPPEPTRRRA
jgi:two-component system, NtrC family, response regulator AtoC